MQKIILSLLVVLGFNNNVWARDKVLVAGDSWAFLPCIFGSAEAAFKKKGLKVDIVDCNLTSKMGVKGRTFKNYWTYDWTKRLLKKDKKKEIKVIYLSLGGNDLIRWWKKDMGPEAELALFLDVKDKIERIIDDFHKINPDVKILLSGYDYAHFVDNHPIPGYRRAFERMGSPDPLTLHQAFFRFSELLVEKLKKPNVSYIHHFGLMHYYYGVPEKGLPPGVTAPPEEISPKWDPNLVGGIVDARTSPRILIDLGKSYDAFHFKRAGFQKIFEHAIDMYIKDWLKSK